MECSGEPHVITILIFRTITSSTKNVCQQRTSFKYYFCQICCFHKRSIINFGNTCRNSNRTQRCRTPECAVINTGNRIGNINRSQTCSAFEHTWTNRSYLRICFKCYFPQTYRLIERIITNTGNTIRNSNFSQTSRTLERSYSNTDDATGNSNGCYSCIIKCINPNRF